MPTVILSNSNTVIKENIMDINFATDVYSSPSSYDLSPGKKEGLVKFDMGLIPNDAIITSAVLKLALNSGTSLPSQVAFHNILGDWVNSTVTWNKRPVIDEAPTTTADVPSGLQSGTIRNFDVTGIIQKQVSSGAVSKGIYLKSISGDVRFGANGNVAPTQRPQLEITYSVPETGKKQVEHVGTTVYGAKGAAIHTIDVPAGKMTGDTLLMFLTCPSSLLDTIVTPDGWELLYKDSGNSTSSLVYKKVSDGTENQVVFKDASNGSFNASCVLKVFRNVKSITQLEYKPNGSPTALWTLPITAVPVNSLLLASASIFQQVGINSWSKNFYGDKSDPSGNYNAGVLYGYNYDKTAFTGSELQFVLSMNASGYSRIIALEPITNTAPNTPPTNNPKGTADTPAILSVSTPKLDWSFSDSDPGDAQTKYQVRIKKASDNSIVHDTGVVTSAVTDYDVPAGVIQKNTLYYWEVQTYDSAGVSSSWSSPEYFKLTDQASVGDKFTFNYTGAPQSFTVPGNVMKVKLEAWGAQGGNKVGVNSDPGKGGYAKGELTVTAGEILNLYVGGKGTDGVSSGQVNSPGGWNGGGIGGKGANNASGGGGGASDVRKGGTALANRILVAGGGGGVSGSVLTRGPYGGGLEGLRGSDGTLERGGYGGTQSAGGAVTGSGATAGSLGVGGNGENNTSNSYGGAGGGGGYYGGGGGTISSPGGGGSSYLGTLANAETTAGLREGDGLITITVLEVSNPPTVTSRAPGSTDQTNPAGSNAAPLFSWDYSGAFTQAKYQIKIFNAQGALAHDTGLIESSAKQHQMAEGVLTAGEVYGWELTVTDDKNVAYPTGRLYIITNRPPGGLTPVSPGDRRRTTLLPVFEATIGDDVENDPQHFVIQLAENSGFTAGLIEHKTSTDVKGWEVKTAEGEYTAFPAEGVPSSYEGGQVKYTVQTPLTEGTTYYWRIAALDASTGARGSWTTARTVRAGNKIDVRLAQPVQTTEAIQRLLIRAQYTLATDGSTPATVRFEATNNAFDEAPVWEDVTAAVLSGDYYIFQNKEKTAVSWGFNLRAVFQANDSLDPIEFYGFGISFD